MVRALKIALVSFTLISSLALTSCTETDPAGSNGPTYPTLNSGELFRILQPNGGETYSYGDTIEVTWLMLKNIVNEAVISAAVDDIPCDVNGQSAEAWAQYPGDVNTTFTKNGTLYLEDLNDSVAVGHFRLPLVDFTDDINGCSVAYNGSNLKVRVWDPYGEEVPCGDLDFDTCFEEIAMGAISGDYSDQPFTVTR